MHIYQDTLLSSVMQLQRLNDKKEVTIQKHL